MGALKRLPKKKSNYKAVRYLKFHSSILIRAISPLVLRLQIPIPSAVARADGPRLFPEDLTLTREVLLSRFLTSYLPPHKSSPGPCT